MPVAQDVEIVSGVSTPGSDVALHKIQPHASLGGDTEPSFLLPANAQASATVVLGNPEGHADLHFTVGEVDLGGGTAGLAGKTGARTLPAGTDPNARSTRGLRCRLGRDRRPAAPDGRRRRRRQLADRDVAAMGRRLLG